MTGDEDNQALLETKLVSILDDLSVEDRGAVTVEEESKDGVLTWLRLTDSKETVPETTQHVSCYDLGGHSPYFNSQKIFKSGSSVFILAFQRSVLETTEESILILNNYNLRDKFEISEFYPIIGVHIENIVR